MKNKHKAAVLKRPFLQKLFLLVILIAGASGGGDRPAISFGTTAWEYRRWSSKPCV
jgi:hypothetical protein